MANLWPVLTVRFSTPPAPLELEIFCARLTAETDCLGVQEVLSNPKDASAPVPDGLKLYYPAVEESAADGMAAKRAALTALGAEVFAHTVLLVEEEKLEDQDWGYTWREYFKTIRVGERLYVRPPWEKLPEDAPGDALAIQIDPGQAFGTGSHETTQLCLRILEKHLKAGGCLLDIGTGSGILGIGAVLLGASFCIGVEYDPVCEENFELNAGLNGVGDRMRFVLDANPANALRCAVSKGAPEPALIVCNMLSERFYPLLPAIRSIGKPVVLSGFLVSESSSVEAATGQNGFAITHRYTLDEWGAFVCVPV